MFKGKATIEGITIQRGVGEKGANGFHLQLQPIGGGDNEFGALNPPALYLPVKSSDGFNVGDTVEITVKKL